MLFPARYQLDRIRVHMEVMVLLSELLLITIVEEFFFAKDDHPTGTYLVGLWSRLMISECGMFNFSTLDTISW